MTINTTDRTAGSAGRPIRRRRLLRGVAGLGLGLATWPLIGGCGGDTSTPPRAATPRSGSPTGRVVRVGWISPGTAQGWSPIIPGFRQALAEYGWVEGRNLILEFRFSEGDDTRDAGNAAELLAAGVEVILATGYSWNAIQQATSSVPIVIVGTDDPVLAGAAASLQRPGGNVTGIGPPPWEFVTGKQLEVFRETVPTLQRIGILWDPTGAGPFWQAGAGVAPVRLANQTKRAVEGFKDGARLLGIDLEPLEVRDRSELATVFAAARDKGVTGVVIHPFNQFYFAAAEIYARAVEQQLPLSCSYRGFQQRILLTYCMESTPMYYDAAGYIDRILRGANPAEMPIERPRQYELILNLKSAADLGLTIPPTVIARATTVIQ